MKRLFTLSIILIFLQIINLFGYFKDYQIKEMFPSSTRIIKQLNANWDFISNSETASLINIPHLTLSNSSLAYQRQFNIDKELLNSFDWSLYFLGISNEVEIYVNEQFIGKFLSNYIPFSVDIPKKILSSKSNVLKLIISSPNNAINYFQNDVFAPASLNGIARDIILIGSPQLFVSNLKYKSNINSANNSATIDLDLEIKSRDLENLAKGVRTDSVAPIIVNSKSFAYQVILREKESKTAIYQSDFAQFSIEPYRSINKKLKINVSNFNLWSLKNPNLYEVVCKIYASGSLIDEHIVNFAFRRLYPNISNGQFNFNGQKFIFNGVGYIETFYQKGKVNLPSKFEEDLKQLKVLGANAIVFKYYYPNPYLLYLCDKYGIMAFIDMPFYNLPNKIIAIENNLANFANQAKNLIRTYSSNPSVMGFGVGKGIEDNSKTYKSYLDRLTNIFKKESDKLVFKTIYPENKNDYSNNIDFLLFQNFESRYNFEVIYKNYSTLINNKAIPVVMTFGVAIQNDNHLGYSNPFSVEYQSYVAQNLYKVSTINDGNGCVINNFNDYYSHYPILQTRYINDRVVTKGLVDINYKNKTSFNFVKALFNEENTPLLDIGNYSTTEYSFILLSLLLIIVIFMMVSRFRRFQEYFIRALLRPYNFYADIRDQRILSPSFTYVLAFILALTYGIYLESLSYHYIVSERFQFLLMLFIPNIYAQSLLFQVIWQPLAGILIFSLLYILQVYVIALIVRLFAYINHRNINHFDVLNITVWGSLPIIFLLPFDLIIFKLLQIDSIVFPIIILLTILILVFSIFRILKATAVVFDLKFDKVYLAGIGIISFFVFVMYIVYQSQIDFTSLLSYYISVLM
jgi:beta-galactosidase